MKTELAILAHNVIDKAKLSKMEDKDKYKVILAFREIKAIAKPFEDFKEDALKKLKGEKHEEYSNIAKKWQEEGENSTLSQSEKNEINSYFSEYNKKVNECIKEELGKEHKTKYEKISKEAFNRFIESNAELTVSEMECAEEALC